MVPVFLLGILDGWGERPPDSYNAITSARTPNLARYRSEFPFTLLEASGECVGLPDGQMGNSEVGHLNIGAGRIVNQDIVRISRSIKDGSLFQNQELKKLAEHCKSHQAPLHLLGLVSDGGVHSSLDHLFALLEFARRERLSKVYLHAFLDGRDTPPRSAIQFLQEVEKKMRELSTGSIATVSGRYYAMDRDKRWERLQKAYSALVLGEAVRADSPVVAVEQAYERGETDEFVLPTVVARDCSPSGEGHATASSGEGVPTALIQPGDGVIFFNFRADRARELCSALALPDFPHFPRKTLSPYLLTMTRYEATFPFPVAFPEENLTATLGEVWSGNGLKQLRISETEKYAHVTYFFNGGREEPFPGEERILIPSSKVATYDLKPEMQAFEITDRLLEAILAGTFQAVVLNFPNGDMVGHTGNFQAAVSAVEAVDTCLGKLASAVLERGGMMIITADHGNAELMFDEETGQPHTAHTTLPVPFHLLGKTLPSRKLRSGGILADIAPTILHLQGTPKPPAMTGTSLLL